MRRLLLPALAAGTLMAVAGSLPAQEASDHTRAANQAVRDALPFEDRTDFENANRGFIAGFDGDAITKAGRSMTSRAWISSPARHRTPPIPA